MTTLFRLLVLLRAVVSSCIGGVQCALAKRAAATASGGGGGDGAAVGLEMETIGSAASSDYTPPEITAAASDDAL